MKRRQFLQVFPGVALSGAVSAPRVFAMSTGGEKIVLGQSAALTGPASELGQQFRDGALCCFEKINVDGGIRGQRIELRIRPALGRE